MFHTDITKISDSVFWHILFLFRRNKIFEYNCQINANNLDFCLILKLVYF